MRVSSQAREIKDTLRALRRAAKRALELGIATGTPLYVMKNNKIVDLTKERPAKKRPSKRASSKKAVSTRRSHA